MAIKSQAGRLIKKRQISASTKICKIESAAKVDLKMDKIGVKISKLKKDPLLLLLSFPFNSFY